MRKLQSLDDLIGFRERVSSEKLMKTETPTLVVSAGTCGQASGANDILRIIKRHILEQNLGDRIELRITGCHGFCQVEPFILVEPGLHLYPQLKMEDVPRVIEAVLGNNIDEDLIYTEPQVGTKYHCQSDIPFFKKQTRTILGSNQMLDPIRIFNYFERGGYAALEKALTKADPEWIIAEIKASRLRGRGGAGFPAGRKWELARAYGNDNQPKYVVCNCDEGDPGAYMDRSLLEGNPHAILEGMLIAGIAIGAAHGIIYVRGEYPLAIKHTMIALRQARELGLLGADILGTGLDFDVEIVRGAGAFVCGEETALIRSVEGFMGEPRQRPPYPIERGIDGCPTCINNVETLANVSVIINRGAAEYAEVGVPGNTGTKIFSLVGKIRDTGLVEVPLGMTLGEVVHVRRLHTGRALRPSRRLRQPEGGRVDHGFGRHDRHGRRHLHGRRRQVLHGLSQGRVVRQVLHLPQGNPADARDSGGHHGGKRVAGPTRTARGARRRGQRHLDVRPRSIGGQPCPQHPSLLPPRVRASHRGQKVRRLRLQGPGWAAVPGGLSSRNRGLALRRLHRPRRVRGRVSGHS
jgi:NADH-quinone oxidoreductase subunit F